MPNIVTAIPIDNSAGGADTAARNASAPKGTSTKRTTTLKIRERRRRYSICTGVSRAVVASSIQFWRANLAAP